MAAAVAGGSLRFSVSDRVECWWQPEGNQPGQWLLGVVIQLWWRQPDWPEGRSMPYQVRLEDGSMVLVGSYISETMIPTMEMIDRGYKLTFATPQGTKPPLDESANSAMYFDNEAQWERAKELWASFPPLQTPLPLPSPLPLLPPLLLPLPLPVLVPRPSLLRQLLPPPKPLPPPLPRTPP